MLVPSFAASLSFHTEARALPDADAVTSVRLGRDEGSPRTERCM